MSACHSRSEHILPQLTVCQNLGADHFTDTSHGFSSAIISNSKTDVFIYNKIW